MNHSAKKQHHEQARKKHKHDAVEHARAAGRRRPSKLPMVFLVVGIAVIVVAVAVISFR